MANERPGQSLDASRQTGVELAQRARRCDRRRQLETSGQSLTGHGYIGAAVSFSHRQSGSDKLLRHS